MWVFIERERKFLPATPTIHPSFPGGSSRVVGPLCAQLPSAGDSLLKKEPQAGKTGEEVKGLNSKGLEEGGV